MIKHCVSFLIKITSTKKYHPQRTRSFTNVFTLRIFVNFVDDLYQLLSYLGQGEGLLLAGRQILESIAAARHLIVADDEGVPRF